MKELLVLFSPQWWTFKNRLFRSDWTAYMKLLFILVLGAGFWFIALHFLSDILTRLEGFEGGVGNIIALKGISLLLMLVFFLLIFSSLLTSINSFYLSRELPVIISAPVSWGNIYFSRWLETAIKSSWMIIFSVLPVFIAFGVYYRASLYYYLALIPVLVIFTMVPVGIGVLLTIFIMAVLPAKRAKNIFLVLGILVFVILFMLFRFLKPERFANPEWFANVTIFLSEIKMPVSVFLPSMWATEVLTNFFNAGGGMPLFFSLLLFFTACAFVVFGNWLFNAFFYKGLVKAQQSRRPGLTVSGMGRNFFSLRSLYSRILQAASSCIKGSRMAIIEKDTNTFFRNIGQWSQMLLLFAVIAVYLFSIKALPVEWGTYLSLKLRYIISFLNIALVGFVITAVASRLVLPSIDSEGPSFWIIRVAPVSMRHFLWSKFLMAFFPLLILAQILIVVSNLFLGVRVWFMILGIGTCAVLVASISGLAIGIGAFSARFTHIASGREQSGFSSTAFMLTAFAMIILTVVLEVIPTIVFFIEEAGADAFAVNWKIVGPLFLAVLVINTAVFLAAMRLGEKRLLSLE